MPAFPGFPRAETPTPGPCVWPGSLLGGRRLPERRSSIAFLQINQGPQVGSRELVVFGEAVGEFEGGIVVALGEVQAKPEHGVLVFIPLAKFLQLVGLGEAAVVGQGEHQRFQVVRELKIVGRLDVLLFVIGALQLDGMGRPFGGLVPFAEAHAQVGLHVEGVRNARRRLEVAHGVGPTERGPADIFVMMHQLVVGAGMKRIDPQERFIKRHAAVGPVGQLGPVEPTFLVLVKERQQLVNRFDGFFFSIGGCDAGAHPFFLEASLNQQLLAVAGMRQELLRLLEGHGMLPLAPFFDGAQRPHQAMAQLGSCLVAISNERAASIQT